MKRGDWVTRDGSDVHEVVQIDDEGHCGKFRCIVPPTGGWIAVGEEEFNLCRRYEVVPIESTAVRAEAQRLLSKSD